MMMFYAFVALCLSGSALAQVPSRGPCPRVKPQSNFDPSRYTGKWYEAARYFALFELNSKCNSYDYTLMENGTLNTDLYLINSAGKVETYERPLYLVDEECPAVRLVQVPLVPSGMLSNFYILGTDYDNYAVCYSCTEYGDQKLQLSWILSRERHPKRSVLTKAYQVLYKNRIGRSRYLKSDQSECPEEENE